jgi:hypothetical protein
MPSNLRPFWKPSPPSSTPSSSAPTRSRPFSASLQSQSSIDISPAGQSRRGHQPQAPSESGLQIFGSILYSGDTNRFSGEKRSVGEWNSMDDRSNREKGDRARQAAEELFKPARREAAVESTTTTSNGATYSEQPPRRQPRIFAAPPRVPVTAPVEPAAEPKPTPRRTVGRRRASTVPPAQNGRVRALVTYGMTPTEVAEHYGVPVGEIERIIAGPSSNRPR